MSKRINIGISDNPPPGVSPQLHRQRELKARGLCVICGLRPLVTVAYCDECRLKRNAQQSVRRKAFFAQARKARR